MQISRFLQNFVEDNIELFENKNKHRELFQKFLFKSDATPQDVRNFFILIESLGDEQLNESIKQHILDLTVEHLNTLRTKISIDYTHTDDEFQPVTYEFDPIVSKKQLIEILEIHVDHVETIENFLATIDLSEPIRFEIPVQIYDGNNDGKDDFVVLPRVWYMQTDYTSNEYYYKIFDNFEKALKTAKLYANNPQKIFEDLLDREYKEMHGAMLPDLDKFI